MDDWDPISKALLPPTEEESGGWGGGGGGKGTNEMQLPDADVEKSSGWVKIEVSLSLQFLQFVCVCRGVCVWVSFKS